MSSSRLEEQNYNMLSYYKKVYKVFLFVKMSLNTEHSVFSILRSFI